MPSNSFNYKMEYKYPENGYQHHQRAMFITRLMPKNKEELAEYEKYSYILINMLYLQCRYPPLVEQRMMELIERVKNVESTKRLREIVNKK